jgi:hypothetical protein
MENNHGEKPADKKAQPMRNIAQMMDELITFEQSIKSIYEKFTDHTTKSIVTGMFQDFGTKMKELGTHLSSSSTQKTTDVSATGAGSKKASKAGFESEDHEDHEEEDEDADISASSHSQEQVKGNAAKSGQKASQKTGQSTNNRHQ